MKRFITDAICRSENLNAVSSFAETVFYRLIAHCDDYGRYEANTAILKGSLFPLKDIRAKQIDDAMQELASAELVILYKVGGKPFVQMRTWARYQSIRAKKSKYPAPPREEWAQDDEGCWVPATEQGGKEPPEHACAQLRADENGCEQMRPYSYPYPYSYANADANARAQEEPEKEALGQALGFWMDNISSPPPRMVVEGLKDYTRRLGAEVVCHALEEAVGANRREWKYIKAILARYEREGLRTLADIVRAEEAYKAGKAGKGGSIVEIDRYAACEGGSL